MEHDSAIRYPAAAWGSRLGSLSRNAWFAYGTILLFQMHRIWWVWSRRDLSGGDTAQYFADAWRFYSAGRTGIAWSPLYTMFYGTLLHTHLSEAGVTILHRMLIVLAAAALVLAVLRKLLPPAIAWALAAWWAVLPVNCDPMYEVHLFALLPILASWWLILAAPNPWGRGLAVAVLVLESLLVRNEMVILAAGTAAVCLAYDWHRTNRVHRSRNRSIARVVVAYAVPSLLALGFVASVYHRSQITWSELSRVLHTKHTMNMAQTYAFGYGQRHPEWTADPWREYQELLRRHFGTDEPSFVQMLRSNPRALLAHIGWNLRLLPAGVQVMLFNATSDDEDPDYRGVPLQSRPATVATVLVTGITLAGGLALWRNRKFWWRAWLRKRWLAWAAMLCGLPVALLIVATQRPRTEYLFNITVLLLALIGTCCMPLLARFRKYKWLKTFAPILMLILAAAVPGVYRKPRPRPVAGEYSLLKPYQELIARTDAVVLSPYSMESSMYVGHGEARYLPYTELARLAPDEPLADFLETRRVNVFLLNPAGRNAVDSRRAGAGEAFVQSATRHGWSVVPFQARHGRGGILFVRPPMKQGSPPVAEPIGRP